MSKENSVIVSTACATGRFARGVVGVATLGLSEVGIMAGKALGALFKKPEIDFDEFDDEFEDEDFFEDDFCEVDPEDEAYECTAEELQKAAEEVESKADAKAPETPKAEPAPAETKQDPQ